MTSVRDATLLAASCGDWCATSATPVPCLPMMLVAVSHPARGREAASSNAQAPVRRLRASFAGWTKAAKIFIWSPVSNAPAINWPSAGAWSQKQAPVSRIMQSRASSTSPHHWLRLHRQKPFTLQFLAGQLAGPAHRLRLFAGALFRGLFIMAAQFHLAKNALPLHLFLEGLINVIVANENLHAGILGEASHRLVGRT